MTVLPDTPSDTGSEPRKATWFELYFDLAFVLAVAALTHRHVSDYTPSGAAAFALQFLVIWSLWVGHTFWASRYDADRPDQHIFGFAKILAIIAIAYGSTGAEHGNLWFACGVGAFKLLLAAAYLRDAFHQRQLRGARLPALVFCLQGMAWIATAFLPDTLRATAWIVLLLAELLSPLLLTRAGDDTLPHPEHMPERFGLFTIILLGEAVASALRGLSHGDAVTREALIVSLNGAALSFLFWVGYFHRARSAAARRAEQVWTTRSVRRWVYAHMPLYLGIAGFSAGTVALAGHGHLGLEIAWLQSAAVALAMIGLTCVGLASPNNLFSPGTAWLHVLLAAVTVLVALLGEVIGAAAFATTLTLLMALQLLAALWIGRKSAAAGF